MAQSDPERISNAPQMTPKWPPNGPQTVPSGCQKGAKWKPKGIPKKMIILMVKFHDFSRMFLIENQVMGAAILMWILMVPRCDNHQKTYKKQWFLMVFHMVA